MSYDVFLEIKNEHKTEIINGYEASVIEHKFILVGKGDYDEIEEIINIYEDCQTKGWVKYEDLVDFAEEGYVLAQEIIENIKHYGFSFNNDDVLEFYIV